MIRATILGCLLLTGAGVPAAAGTGALPLLFEQRSPEEYQVRGAGFGVRVEPAGMTLVTSGGAATLRWTAASPSALRAEERQAAMIHEFLGSDPKQWRRGIPTFGALRQRDVFPGIDLHYYGNRKALEYDFLVAPGADPGRIRFTLPAVLSESGDLALANGLRWKRPVAHQGGRAVDARFVAAAPGEFGIEVGAYDRSRTLVIDPVLAYSTYLGGSLADEASGIAADEAGNAYVTGTTLSTNFPGAPARVTGGQEVFVAKLNATGTALLWAAYLGGNGTDAGGAIATDSTGAVYVTGQTASTNFPITPGAPQAQLLGGNGITDAFVLRLSPDGQTLDYSTYIGGTQSELGNAIAVDAQQNAYVAGRTDSTDFPSTTRTTLPARGAGDGFVLKLSPTGGSVVYASLLGGFAMDQVNGIIVDAAGAAYVTGETRSDNFPVTESAYQKERRGSSDAFVSKLSADGATLLFSTYFGGDGTETGTAIGRDRNNNLLIAGATASIDLPVSFNAAQRSATLLPDAFVAKLDSAASSVTWATYLGGDGDDQAEALAVAPDGSVHVAGYTSSTNFPVFADGPLLSTPSRGGYDGFLTRVSPGGNFFQFSTHFGGTGTDRIFAMAADSRGRFWVAGGTASTDLPVTAGTFAATAPAGPNGFAALLSEINVRVEPATVTLGPRESRQFTATVTNAANTAVRWSIFPAIGSISSTGLYTAPDTIGNDVVVTVSAISLADGGKIGEAILTLTNRVTVVVAPLEISLAPGRSQQFMATVSGIENRTVNWSLTPSTGTISATGLYTAPPVFAGAATVTVRATSVAEPARSGTATVRLIEGTPPPVPVATAAGMTNAASFRAVTADGGIAPGELITLFGENMGPDVPAGLQLDGRGFVANRLAGTRVLFDGTPGAMIATSIGQVSVVVPYEVEGKSSVQVQVEYEGRVSAPAAVPVIPASPGIFTQNSSGSGPGSIIRPSGQLITAAAPALAGEILLLYATGEGATNPAGVDGKPTDASLPRPKLPVVVVVDGVDVVPDYAGGAPGLVAGVLQVNFTMPPGSGSSRRIQLRIGGRLSPETVTIPAQ